MIPDYPARKRSDKWEPDILCGPRGHVWEIVGDEEEYPPNDAVCVCGKLKWKDRRKLNTTE